MSESTNPRFAVDLSEIERQIAQAQSAPAQPAPAASRNDPLAELARIVGQDDPFQSLLASEGSAQPRPQSSAIDDLFAVRDNAAPAPRVAQPRRRQANLDTPEFDLGHYPQAGTRGDEAYAYQSAAPAQGQGAYGGEAYAPDYYEEDGADYAAPAYAQPQRLNYPSLEKGRSRKGLIAIGAVLGAAVLGVGGAYMLGDGSSATADGNPPLVKAATDPIKVPPQNPGGVEIPNQNKQIYERANQNGDTKVVNREEQPIDVNQAVRMTANDMADATGATVPAMAPQAVAGLNLGEPRKVRTVSIRPDGTVVSPDADNARPGPAPATGMVMPAEAQAPAAAPATPGNAQPAPAQPKPASSTPAAVAAAPAPKPAPSASTPASGASPQRTASTQPVTLTPPAAAPETAPTGGYAVQLGLANSEDGAEAALVQFQKKYSELQGLPPIIRKAEVNGNTIFRVRVGPMSREEASSLCSKLQGQGGQCFVAKN